MKRFLAAGLLLLGASPCLHAQTGKAPWEKYGDRIAAHQDVGSLDDGLFGDSVAVGKGALSFSQTDVSLPGNAGPPVALTRHYKVQDRRYKGTDGMFGDWDAALPQISGIYAQDWVDRTGGTARCSVGGPPAQHASDGVQAFDFWQGLSIDIPGVGRGEVLSRLPTTPVPSGGGSYPYVTNEHVRISCLPSIRNGTGEGFLAITPDGTRYWFDWMSQQGEAPLRRGTNLLMTTDPLGNPIPREFTIPLRRNVLWATRVEDRFGNVVTYTYSNAWNERARLTRINSGGANGVGGDGRQIDVAYSNGWISSVTDGTGRTWTYTYANSPGNRRTLTRVAVPGGSAWTIDFKRLTDAELKYTELFDPMEPMRTCTADLVPENTGADATPTGTIAHPSGAVGTFVTGIVEHRRTNVPLNCINVTTEVGKPLGFGNDKTDDVALIPNHYDAFSATSKTIAGPGLPTAQWTYSYSSPGGYYRYEGTTNAYPVCTAGHHECRARPPACATPGSCSTVATMTVANPENTWTRYAVGNSFRGNEGLLMKVETGTGAGPSATLVNGRPDNALRVVTHAYDLSETGAWPTSECAWRFGAGMRPNRDSHANECLRPKLKTVTWQQGVDFTWQATALNAFAQPVEEKRYSASAAGSSGYAGHDRTDTTAYLDNADTQAKWVLGLVTSRTNVDLGLITERTDYLAGSLLPGTIYWPQRASGGSPLVKQTLTYAANGTLATVKDGRTFTTTLSHWHRGVPQSIAYPDATTQSAVVNDRGEITRITDQNGFATNYTYDARGLLASVTHPAGDAVAWNATSLDFVQTAAAEYGFAAGTWRRTVSTGTARKVTWFDAMWRPRMTREFDNANAAATQRFNAWRYDGLGRTVFVAYPLASAASAASFTLGTDTLYDALGRATSVSQDSEHGTLTTLNDYVDAFRTRTTNPRGRITTTSYQAFDTPDTGAPSLIDAPAGQRTTIVRDDLGRALSMVRSGTLPGQTEVVTRGYAYDERGRLCQRNEPETGATVLQYDASGNVTWSAAGLGLALPTSPAQCETRRGTANASGRRVDRTYDALDRLLTLKFPNDTGNQTWTYTPDGLPATIATTNNGANERVNNAYAYNRRRLLASETSEQPGAYTWTARYGYDANGHLASLTYPSGLVVSFAPNALGQPTRAGAFATGVQYHPNGAIKQFTYGNGIVHQMWQNARQLPARSADGSVIDVQHGFDPNANVVASIDALDADRSRWMEYDDLDRLTAAGSAQFGGDHWHRYTYDVQDNLRSWTLGGVKDYATYQYDANNRLVAIRNGANVVVHAYGYDVQGNLANKNGVAYAFDYGNRYRGMGGQEGMRYDGHGRRVSTWLPGLQRARFYMYAHSGQLLFEGSETKGINTEHVYLGGSLVAGREYVHGSGITRTRYTHTDALGSPVATTDEAGAVVDRTAYEPYGRTIGETHEGIGFTGHVMDPQSGLVYMQQRYYDADAGRFLSVDPVDADTITSFNFNRYAYAANSPYTFTDPDGRMIQRPWNEPWRGDDPFRRVTDPCRWNVCLSAGADASKKSDEHDADSDDDGVDDDVEARNDEGREAIGWMRRAGDLIKRLFKGPVGRTTEDTIDAGADLGEEAIDQMERRTGGTLTLRTRACLDAASDACHHEMEATQAAEAAAARGD